MWNAARIAVGVLTDLVGTASANTLTGTASSDNILGLGGNDVLFGLDGHDRLDGGAGDDSMAGGQGDDAYFVDSAGDVVTENANEGTDTVYASIAHTLGPNVENLTLMGTAPINGTGNSLANVLIGNGAANTLDGGTGADTMIGGLGDDIYVVDNPGDVVVESAGAGIDAVVTSVSYTLGSEVENLFANSVGAINLTGNALDNVLVAGAGNNTLDGAAGNDTASYITAGAGVTVDLNSSAAQATGGSGSDTLLNIENLQGSAYNDVLTGNAGANVLLGEAGADILIGGAGTNTLAGGPGDDIYVVDGATDVVVENFNEGSDSVLTSVSHTLGANVENLIAISTGAIDLRGNTLDNLLVAGAGNNTIDGAAGNDTASYITAGAGVTVDLGSSAAQATGGSGSDTLVNIENLQGSAYNDVLLGNSAANVLLGDAGADILAGGAGADLLAGGLGNDVYVLGRGYANDTLVENDATPGNTDLALFGTDIAADQLWFQQASNNLEVSIIGTGDRFTIYNWYLGNPYHVEQFQTSGGQALLESQVQNLVNAMAAFSPPAMGETHLSAAYASQLAPVIAANWQ